MAAADNYHGGLYVSTDGGLSWEGSTAAGFDSPVRSITEDPADSRRLYLGTTSEGVYRVQLLKSLALKEPG
ncbi:MAG: hypothetical protein HXY20_13675 [Acidobacteria bacterium]|nr:hypothetical protein [Acidobacteriota bacterium]